MADTSKAQKLASARKKYKDLLKEKKKNSTQNTAENTSRGQTPVESLTSSTHSSVTNEQFVDHIGHESSTNKSPLPNYFGNTNYDNNLQESVLQPSTFFDNITQNYQNTSESNIPQIDANNGIYNMSDHFTLQGSQGFHTNPATYFNNLSSGNTNFLEPQITAENNFVPQSQQENAVSFDYPEIKQNEIFNMHQENEHHKLISEKDTKELLNYLNVTERTPEEPDKTENQVQHSNIESLKQLSNQMAELIEPNSEYNVSSSVTDLEKRNLELATLLDQERIRSEQLNATVQEYKSRISSLEVECKEKESNITIQSAQEISRLKNELQNHIQTFGVLVAEKTELSASLNQFEIVAKQKSAECEELQARLKTSRSRVADLEREINLIKSDKSKNESYGKEQIEAFDKLKFDFKTLKDEKDELVQDLLEVREKLKTTSESNVTLQQQNQDLSSKLSLANIKIQQLTSGETLQVDTQVEQLTQEKFALEKQISNLNEMLKTITKERDESSVQYQQYAQQLNNQMSNLATRIEQLQQENENLLQQENNRIKHIGELERQLQNLQSEQVNFATNTSSDSNLKNEIEASRKLCVQLQIDKTEIEEKFTKISNEKEMLMKELEAKSDSIAQLESMVEQLRGNQPDSVKLLAAMESDKVAAARAVSQNKELKQQMEGMQEVFIKLNNDKIELTEKLTIHQQTTKDLLEKLQKTEVHLQTLADAIEIKDKELSYLRDNSTELNRQVLQHEQLADRLRHYEAQDHSSQSLQNELQEAKLTITKLTNEINQLKVANSFKENTNNTTETTNSDEIEELKRKLKELELKNIELEHKSSQTVIPTNDITDSFNVNKNESYTNDELHSIDKEVAMRYLEDKFKRTMQDIADLTDEKQRLEHLVLQLQSETETIGEYVALYQHQRSILKQKALEKDQQLKQLAIDRQQIKSKLNQLNELVKKLVIEKGHINPELLQQHANLNSDALCEEHSKMHSEISNIDVSQVNNGENGYSENCETAEQIMALLSEIKTSNLVQPSENLHHCAWCSGQLITV